MKCDICSRPLGSPDENPFHPLCSQRCRMVDLGKWLSGSYVIADPPGLGGDGGDGGDGFTGFEPLEPE